MAYDTSDKQTMQVLVDAVPVIRPSGTASPEFMVKMDDILSSQHDYGEGKYAELLWFHSVEERMTAGHAGGDLKGTSTVVHSLVVLHLLADNWTPVLRQKMRNGDNIKEIDIVRLMNYGESNINKETQKTKFTDCKIDRIEEFPDRIIVSIRIKIRRDIVRAVDQDNQEQGHKASDWNYATAKENT
jgi:type VI protein secretion system component Hcp